MFSYNPELIFSFVSRSFWDDVEISREMVKKTFIEYLGENNRTITTCSDAIIFISPIIDRLQKLFVNWMKTENASIVIGKLYYIFNICFNYYISQKNQRKELVELNISDSEIVQVFDQNKNITLNLLVSVNLWLENALLYQNNDKTPVKLPSCLDSELLIKLYLYGLLSRNLSLLALSDRHSNLNLFYGIDIKLDNDEPIVTLKEHPVIYYNPLLAGNQEIFLVSNEEYKNASKSDYGKGFNEEYSVDFLLSLRVMSTFQYDLLKNDKSRIVMITRKTFLKIITDYTSDKIDAEKYFDAFVLTREKIHNQLRRGESVIWKTGTNKYRHEIRPFLCLDNNNIIISYPALEQSKNIWLSYFANGGMIYTNEKDLLTNAIEKRNDELSKKLVDIIRNKLNNHYKSGFDEIDVDYMKIFGKKEYNYGDYDLVFFAKDVNELFLIEAKYFSDSLNNSGMITDYQKLFKSSGYYVRCRKRYDLVLQNVESMKSYIGVSGKIHAHFLFVSSKPLEIEFQDEDGIVSFPCLSIFDKYLEGKLISEDGKSIIRPTHFI